MLTCRSVTSPRLCWGSAALSVSEAAPAGTGSESASLQGRKRTCCSDTTQQHGRLRSGVPRPAVGETSSTLRESLTPVGFSVAEDLSVRLGNAGKRNPDVRPRPWRADHRARRMHGHDAQFHLWHLPAGQILKEQVNGMATVFYLVGWGWNCSSEHHERVDKCLELFCRRGDSATNFKSYEILHRGGSACSSGHFWPMKWF